jgi:hypothetical protein
MLNSKPIVLKQEAVNLTISFEYERHLERERVNEK